MDELRNFQTFFCIFSNTEINFSLLTFLKHKKIFMGAEVQKILKAYRFNEHINDARGSIYIKYFMILKLKTFFLIEC